MSDEEESTVITDFDGSPLAVLTPEERELAFTQDIRRQIITKLHDETTGQLRDDLDSLKLTASVLNNMDTQTLTQMKLKQEANKNNVDSNQVAKLLELMTHRLDMQGGHVDTAPARVEKVINPGFLPEAEYLEGELDIKESETPEEFLDRIRAENPDLRNGQAVESDD